MCTPGAKGRTGNWDMVVEGEYYAFKKCFSVGNWRQYMLACIFAARIGQPPISALISRLKVICLLVVPRFHCVERPGPTA